VRAQDADLLAVKGIPYGAFAGRFEGVVCKWRFLAGLLEAWEMMGGRCHRSGNWLFAEHYLKM
jgi:hypothetical protein